MDADDIKAGIGELETMLEELNKELESHSAAESNYIIAEEGRKALLATYFLKFSGSVKERECEALALWNLTDREAWEKTVNARIRSRYQRDNLMATISATQSKLSKLSAFIPR